MQDKSTTVYVDAATSKFLEAIQEHEAIGASALVRRLITEYALRMDNGTDPTARVTIDYQTRTLATESASGRKYCGPLTPRTWEIFRSGALITDMEGF